MDSSTLCGVSSGSVLFLSIQDILTFSVFPFSENGSLSSRTIFKRFQLFKYPNFSSELSRKNSLSVSMHKISV